MIDEAALVLANCLDALERREFTLDEFVARHPDQYTVLTELVPVAQRLRAAPDVRPSPDFRADARQHLIARLPSRRTHRSRFHWPQPVRMVRALAALLILIVLGSSVVAASAQSLPNEVLYPVKITVEQVRLALSPDQLTRSELSLGFADERLIEVQRLIDRGQGSETAGSLDAFAAQIQSAAEMARELPTGAEREALLARLQGSLDRSAEVLDASEAQLPASMQASVERARAALRAVPPRHTPTPLPAATPTQTLTSTPTSTEKPPAIKTRAPRATATPQPGVMPTLRPTHVTPTRSTPATIQWPTRMPTRWLTTLPTLVATWFPTFVPPTWPTRPPRATIIPGQFPTWPPDATIPPPIFPTWPAPGSPPATMVWPTPRHR